MRSQISFCLGLTETGPCGVLLERLALRERLETLLPTLVAEGQRAWPGVALSPGRFAEHLARSIRAIPEDLANALGALHATDLYLACACVHGDRSALEALDVHFLSRIDHHVLPVEKTVQFVDDVRQRMREELLLAGKRPVGKIADYSGRGPLAGWLRVVAVRTALNLRRSQATAPDTDDLDAAKRMNSCAPDPELDYLKTR